MRFVKPLDESLLLELARSHEALVTLEDNVVAGGAGSAVGELFAAHGIEVPLLQLGLPDRFLEHARQGMQQWWQQMELVGGDLRVGEAGLDAGGIRRAILARFPQYAQAPAVRGAI